MTQTLHKGHLLFVSKCRTVLGEDNHAGEFRISNTPPPKQLKQKLYSEWKSLLFHLQYTFYTYMCTLILQACSWLLQTSQPPMHIALALFSRNLPSASLNLHSPNFRTTAPLCLGLNTQFTVPCLLVLCPPWRQFWSTWQIKVVQTSMQIDFLMVVMKEQGSVCVESVFLHWTGTISSRTPSRTNRRSHWILPSHHGQNVTGYNLGYRNRMEQGVCVRTNVR